MASRKRYSDESESCFIDELTDDEGNIHYILMIAAKARPEIEIMRSNYLHVLYAYLMNSKAIFHIKPSCRDIVLGLGSAYAEEFLESPKQMEVITAEIDALMPYYEEDEIPTEGEHNVH